LGRHGAAGEHGRERLAISERKLGAEVAGRLARHRAAAMLTALALVVLLVLHLVDAAGLGIGGVGRDFVAGLLGVGLLVFLGLVFFFVPVLLLFRLLVASGQRGQRKGDGEHHGQRTHGRSLPRWREWSISRQLTCGLRVIGANRK